MITKQEIKQVILEVLRESVVDPDGIVNFSDNSKRDEFKENDVESQLDEFTRAYLEAALWSSFDDEQEPLDKNYGVENISKDSINQAAYECRQFQSKYRMLYKSLGDSLAGHDFWLTRNGHGSGFWDEEKLDEETQEALTKAAESFKGKDAIVGDDGLIYLE